MPSGEWDPFLKANLKKYRKPEKTLKDVRPLLAQFKELQPRMGAMETSKGKEKKLICIQGNVSITPPQPNYGRGFNMPVCVWLLDTHPEDPPACYLAPIKDFVLQPSKFLDAKGKIYLPYLHEWKAPKSNLCELFRIFQEIFTKYFPYVSVGSTVQPPRGASPGVATPGSASPALPGIHLRGERVTDSDRVNRILSVMPKPKDTVRDISSVLDMFPDLAVKPAVHAFTEGPRTEHLTIEGTIPIVYKGNNYNIPITVWLRNNYPASSPHCFVIPAEGMRVKPSKFVDRSGKVYLPYLHEWKYPSSDLSGLIQVMCLIFGETCPVYSTSEASPARARASQLVPPSAAEQPKKPDPSEEGAASSPLTQSGPRIRLGAQDGTLVKKIKEENERLKDSQMCKICMDEEMQVLFVPCNHMVACDECSKIVKQCPICRVDITNTLRVYKS